VAHLLCFEDNVCGKERQEKKNFYSCEVQKSYNAGELFTMRKKGVLQLALQLNF